MSDVTLAGGSGIWVGHPTPSPASTAFPMPPPRLLGGAVLRVGSIVDQVDFRARAEASRTSQAQGLGF